MAGFWNTISDPFFGVASMTPLGLGGGLAYTAAKNQNQNAYNQQIDPYSGMPLAPGYNQSPNGMPDQIQNQLNGLDMSGLQSSVRNFSDMANRQGPSAWATLAGQQQNALMNNELERGAAQGNAAEANAQGQLASSGGLSSGARERTAELGQTNRMNMAQNAGRQNSLNQLQIGVNDQQNKIQQMGMLPGLEAQALEPQFQKINAQAQEQQRQNDYNQHLYDQQMQVWAANKQAQATQNAGKHGFLGLGK